MLRVLQFHPDDRACADALQSNPAGRFVAYYDRSDSDAHSPRGVVVVDASFRCERSGRGGGRAPLASRAGLAARRLLVAVSRLVARLTRLWTKPPHVDRRELVLRSARGAVYLRVPGPERRAARWEAALGALAERSGARAMVARQARGTLLSALVPRYA